MICKIKNLHIDINNEAVLTIISYSAASAVVMLNETWSRVNTDNE